MITPAPAASRHDRIAELFHVACELPPQQREEYLRYACGDDADLHRDVVELVARDSTAAPLDRPVIELASSFSSAPDGQERRHPRRIARYEILDVLGEGGMGTVYRARQENPDRIVALKVIRPGLASRSMIRRFELEAHLVGRLQHPGIAQIFEAGTFEAGHGPQPYFAMEIANGRPLLDHARRENLSVRQRLELMGMICDALHHAHQKGIVHRDLKPGNIMVDSSGHPKILDFGVARATDADLKITTLQTDVGQLVGTLPYMSPEQVAGQPDEIDVRSDVYALGVITFELLTGQLPHNLDQQPVLEAARIIRDEPPLRLSSLRRELRGDLDTIVSKSLEKDKACRYQSASDLGNDLRRYLRDEPIVARPASRLYQMRKFARRNRTLVAGGALGLAALLMAVVVSTTFAIRSQRAATRETKQRQVAERTTEHLKRMLALANPHAEGSGTSVIEMLDVMAARLDGEAELPQVEAELRTTIGRTYVNLRKPQQALDQLQRAIELWREIDPDGPRLADALVPSGVAHLHLGNAQASEAAYREAIPIFDRAGGPAADQARGALLDMLLREHRFREASPIAQALLEVDVRNNDMVMIIARRRQLGKIQSGLGDYEDARQQFDQARDLASRHLPENHPIQIGVLLDIGMTSRNMGDKDGALKATGEAFSLVQRVGKPGTHDWATSLVAYLECLEALDRR